MLSTLPDATTATSGEYFANLAAGYDTVRHPVYSTMRLAEKTGATFVPSHECRPIQRRIAAKNPGNGMSMNRCPFTPLPLSRPHLYELSRDADSYLLRRIRADIQSDRRVDPVDIALRKAFGE